MKPLMNLAEVEFDDVEENGIYTSSRGQISDHIGARKLGYNLTVLPAGKVQCPFHCHHGEEEMFLILEGEGELRFGDKVDTGLRDRHAIHDRDVFLLGVGCVSRLKYGEAGDGKGKQQCGFDQIHRSSFG